MTLHTILRKGTLMKVLKKQNQHSRWIYFLPVISFLSFTQLLPSAAGAGTTSATDLPAIAAQLNTEQGITECFTGPWKTLKWLVYMSYNRRDCDHERLAAEIERLYFPPGDVFAVGSSSANMREKLIIYDELRDGVYTTGHLVKTFILNLYRAARVAQHNAGQPLTSGAAPLTLANSVHSEIAPLLNTDTFQVGMTSLCTQDATVHLENGTLFLIPTHPILERWAVFRKENVSKIIKSVIVLLEYCYNQITFTAPDKTFTKKILMLDQISQGKHPQIALRVCGSYRTTLAKSLSCDVDCFPYSQIDEMGNIKYTAKELPGNRFVNPFVQKVMKTFVTKPRHYTPTSAAITAAA